MRGRLIDDMLRDRPRMLVLPNYHSWGGTPFRDLSGYGRTFTWNTGPVGTTPAPIPPGEPRAARQPRFNGNYFTDSANDTSMQVGTGDFAFEWWMLCTNDTSNYVQLLGRDTGASGSYQLVYLNITTGVMLTYPGPVVGNTRLSDSKLHHCVYQRRNGMTEHYIDARLDRTAAMTTNIVSGTAFRFGTADGSYNYFAGWAGPVAYYNKALHPAAIKRRWQLGLNGLWTPERRGLLAA